PSDFPIGNTYRIRIIDNKLSELQDEMSSSFEIREGTVITDQVKWRNVCVGEGAWFYVRATGAGTLTYQWKKNGTPLVGETRDELQLQNLQMTDNLSLFTCEIKGDCGTVESEPALLKVFTSALIVKELENDTTCLGGSALFEIEAEGSNLTYKWFYRSPGGVNKSFDVNSPQFIITNAKQEDFGSYWCEVTSSCGKSTSKIRFLIVPQNSVEVLAPSVWNQVLPAGSQYMIGWKQFCLSTVKIEYSTNGGSSWNLITGSFDAAAGEYLWNIPVVDADQCFIRISDANNPATNNQSKQFKIKDIPVYSRNLDAVGFSWVAVGSSAQSPLKIFNTGRADLQVTATRLTDLNGAALADVVITNGAPFSVGPASDYVLILEFTPSTASRMDGKLIITHNAAGSPDTVDVLGEGFIATSTGDLSHPLQLALNQNYPNPVSIAQGAHTQIVFDLPRRSNVQVALYNTLGQQLRALYSGSREAGRHTLGVDLNGIAPGMYLYRLSTGSEAVTRVMHVIR
ncbi:MAG: T9SS type A sorting domain-containing protein, partial [Bacteroidota bacterium]